jgi:hypothetical protein
MFRMQVVEKSEPVYFSVSPRQFQVIMQEQALFAFLNLIQHSMTMRRRCLVYDSQVIIVKQSLVRHMLRDLHLYTHIYLIKLYLIIVLLKYFIPYMSVNTGNNFFQVLQQKLQKQFLRLGWV